MTSRVLKILIDNLGVAVSGSDMGALLGVSRASVSKHITKLKDSGYDISSATNNGHCLKSLPQFTDGILLTALTDVKSEYLKKCPSTNLYARGLVNNSDTVLVAAGEQSSGRGRKGRDFDSGVGGAYFSVISRALKLPAAQSMLLSLAAGLAVRQALQGYGIEGVLKYPNDVLVDGRKMCGVLTETMSDPDYLQWAVTGIGININNRLPYDLTESATTLSQVLGRKTDIAPVIAAVVKSFLVIMDNPDKIVPLYKAQCAMLNNYITVIEDNKTYTAKAVDIDNNGYLKIEVNNKTVYAVGCDLSYR